MDVGVAPVGAAPTFTSRPGARIGQSPFRAARRLAATWAASPGA